jgi:hypothetical protein
MKKISKKQKVKYLNDKREAVMKLKDQIDCIHWSLIRNLLEIEDDPEVKAYAYSAGLSLGQARELVELMQVALNVKIGKVS